VDDPRIGRVVAGRYKLSAQLAEGGMGVVYRGERVGIGRPVVVKFLHAMLSEKAGIVDRFEREARATALINHPNCVALVDFGLDEGAPFLVMEYAEGRTLADVLDHGPIAPARAVRIIMQVLSGLAHAHARGILHRDLKPANVMIVDLAGFDDFVKILDFGLAKMVGPVANGDKRDVTVEGIAIGTPGYMSPEQAAGIPSDRRADIYCTGALLYHMVTGQKAFDGEDLHSVLRRHREETPIAPAAVVPSVRISAQLEDIVLRSMKREPSDRYQSADAMILALKDTPEARSESVAKRPHSRPPENDTRAERPQSRARERGGGYAMRWLFLGGLVGATTAAGGILYVQKPPAEIEPPAVASVPPPPLPKALPAPKIAEPTPTPTPEPQAVVEAPRAADDDGSGEDDRAPPPEAAAAPHNDAAPVRTVADARNLLRKGDADGALAGLLHLRRQKPPPARAAEIAQLVGHLYFDRHWWTDALKEYRFAITLDGKARRDSVLVANAVRTLGDNATFPRGRKLIVSYIGKNALGALKKAAHSGASPLLRKNAALVLAQMKPAHAKNR
jgi:eukaryotic-like serine/threonine-protein kinase